MHGYVGKEWAKIHSDTNTHSVYRECERHLSLFHSVNSVVFRT